MVAANQRNRKKRIKGLEGPDGWTDDNHGMLEHAVNFYKNLFGEEPSNGVRLKDDFWDEDDLVTVDENEALQVPFTEDEVRNAVFSSYAEGAPGPDGLPFLFYQTLWDTIKGDFMNLVSLFEKEI